MQIETISLEGFRSWKQATTHDFRTTPAAVIVGRNGHGKSSFFVEAIEWILFGTSKSRTVDGVITIGEDRASGELVFVVDGVRYRVRRTRSRSAVTLDLYVETNDGWTPFKTGRVRETDAEICKVIGSTRDVLLSSALLRQGDTGRFTRSTPSARRGVLRQLLRLDRWDAAATGASQRLTTSKRALAAVLDDLDRLGDHGGLLAAAQVAKADAERELDEVQAELATARAALQDADGEVDAASEALAEAMTYHSRVMAAGSEAELARQQMERLDRLLDEKRQASAKVRELRPLVESVEGVRERVEVQAEALRQAEADSLRKAELNQQLTWAEQRLTDARRTLADVQRSNRLRQGAIDDLGFDSPLDVAIERLRDTAASLPDRIERTRLNLKAAQDAATQLAALRAEQQAAADAGMLLDQAPCADANEWRAGPWVCDLASTCPLLENARAQRRRAAEISAQIDVLSAQSSPADTMSLLKDLYETQSRVERTLASATSIPDERDEAEAANAVDHAASAVKDIRSSLEDLGGPIDWLSLRQRLDADRAELRAAEAAAPLYEAAVQAAEGHDVAVAEWREAVADYDAKATALDALCDEAPDVEAIRERCAAARRQREDVRGRIQLLTDVQLRQASAALSTAESAVEHAEANSRRAAQLEVERDTAMLDVRRWSSTLEVAQLAPVLVIENFAIPTLESEVNSVLASISSTGMSVELRTQRQKARGEGLIETLDIIIRDETGERAYEDYSGGEQFRVDIAFALAQSTLLASRRSSPVDWLIIDEGWGTLDTGGVEALKDVLTSLQQRYSLLLVITHVESVAECLPHQIVVERSPDGSVLR